MYRDVTCRGHESMHDCCLNRDLRDLDAARGACDELRTQLAMRGSRPSVVAIKDGTAKVFVEGGDWYDNPSFRDEFADADQVFIITRWEWYP